MSADLHGPAPRICLLASLKLTLLVLLLLGGGILYGYLGDGTYTWSVALPLALLALNLSAAVLCNRAFRAQPPLLIFHLALILVVIMVGVARMTYLKGHVGVSAGAEFDGVLSSFEAGPLHPFHLDQARFRNEWFQVNFAPGPKRLDTSNLVSWVDDVGRRVQAKIGDQIPLVRDGYRFYVTHNKGFAPRFTWAPHSGGPPQNGDIHLPPYPANLHRQSLDWTPPGSSEPVWVMLDFDETILSPDAPSVFRPPSEHSLIVRVGDVRHELIPGDTIELRDGLLVYQGLATWMGYQVFYDWTRPWLIAGCLLVAASLGWHLWVRFSRRSWISD